uniref:UDP-glucuronosyltransferase n=1 Tax=Oryzias latipes TaxID=8090 RepID=A0A3P9LIZ5_ORYLA
MISRRSSSGVFLVFSLIFWSWRIGQAGRILIFPLEGSHWVNMDIMIKALHSRGHHIDVMRTNKSWYIKDDAPHYKTVTVSVAKTFDKDFINPILKKNFAIERGKTSIMSFISFQIELFRAMFDMHGMMCKMATTMLEDKELMGVLRRKKYDLVLTDPAWGAGIILAHALELPLVYNVRWVTSGEGHLTITPSPLSYIPMTGSGLTDKMTFIQRFKNLLFYALWQIQDMLFFFGPNVKYTQLLQGADLWLMRVDFVFEFPRPTMPNVVYVGGFHCKPSKPLPEHLEEFVQSSGEHGVIIMSLGTFVSELPDDLANEIAAAFAKLPQKVIWSYRGSRPSTLGNNTLVVDWIPQNDLLGHPNIKLFVAHGGTNGVQEAIYHGVPVVGLPICHDQYDNLLRLQVKGAAKIIPIATLDKDDSFLKAIQEVLTEPSYRMNMQRLSRLHRDQPVKQMDKALFWIEFVMRHKGAAHLVTESNKMPWYSYYSVDVVAFSFAVATFISFSLFVCKKTAGRVLYTE